MSKVAIGRGTRERIRQVRRDHSRHEKRQPDESKGVQQEQRSKRLRTRSKPERGQMYRAPISPHTTTPMSTLISEDHLRFHRRLRAVPGGSVELVRLFASTSLVLGPRVCSG